MKKEFVLLFFGASLVIITTDTLLTSQITYATKAETNIQNRKNSYDVNENRVGFYQQPHKKRNDFLLNQKMDLSSGIKIQKKYPYPLNYHNSTDTYLGTLYSSLAGHLIFGRVSI